MYKLFLCLRYLRRRYIALVAIVGVTLCVAMVLIVVSVMNGFLDMIETAARGIMGDVIVDDTSGGGLGRYEELMAAVRKMPEVESVTPVIYSYGLFRVGSSFTQPVRLVGIRLPEAAGVTEFGRKLYPDSLRQSPSFQLPPKERAQALADSGRAKKLIDEMTAELDTLKSRQEAELQKPLAEQDKGLLQTLDSQITEREVYVGNLRPVVRTPYLPGVIAGVDIPGTTERDEVNSEISRRLPVGHTVILTMLPIGRGRLSNLEGPIDKPFALVGDSRMGIFAIDSMNVYIDFDELQTLLDMAEKVDVDTGRADPGRCNQVQIKARPGLSERELHALAEKVMAVWQGIVGEHPELIGAFVEVKTWREKQALFIGPLENQRTLMVIMFGIISLVAVVLVFAIFYMMVVQKTKDIGVIKSLGGSNAGVAGIFLMYGGAIGLVGSLIGVGLGWTFVQHINPIHDWIARVFHWRMWDRRAYLFDQIPHRVDPEVIVGVVISAILAGLIGSLIPAMRASRMQPVEALRYE